MRPVELETDVLVLGGGSAGLCAAMAAREAGARVTLAYKRGGNATAVAAGGYAVVLPGAADDSMDRLMADALRSGTELLCAFFRTHEKNLLRDALRYGGILLTFAAGAGLGSVASLAWGAPAIWCSCVFLAAGFGLMFLSGAPGGENDGGKGV